MGIKRDDLHSHIKLVVDMNSYLTLQSIEDSVYEYSQVAFNRTITVDPVQNSQMFTPLDEKHFPQQMLPMIQHLNSIRLGNPPAFSLGKERGQVSTTYRISCT